MATELAALRVKILRKPNGRGAAYPPFNALPVVQASGLDWSQYVDVHGSGWMYDKKSGHDDEDAVSPRGQQFGLLLVPEQFVIEAVATFPNECTRLTEAEAEAFYDARVAFDQQDEVDSHEVLQGLQKKFQLAQSLNASQARINEIKAQITKAIDPDDDHPGVRRNWRANFVRWKAKRQVTIKDPS